MTVYEKWETRHMGIFAKIEIALYMSSTNLDLTLLQIRDWSPVPFPRYHAFCLPSHELLNLRIYELKALPCTRLWGPYIITHVHKLIFFFNGAGRSRWIQQTGRVFLDKIMWKTRYVFIFTQLAQKEGRSISKFNENSCFLMSHVRQLQLASVATTLFTSSWAVRQSKFLAYGAQVRQFWRL